MVERDPDRRTKTEVGPEAAPERRPAEAGRCLAGPMYGKPNRFGRRRRRGRNGRGRGRFWHGGFWMGFLLIFVLLFLLWFLWVRVVRERLLLASPETEELVMQFRVLLMRLDHSGLVVFQSSRGFPHRGGQPHWRLRRMRLVGSQRGGGGGSRRSR